MLRAPEWSVGARGTGEFSDQRVAHVAWGMTSILCRLLDRDPADDRVLECAVAGGASFIIAGNEHLLKIKKYREIVILKPVEFRAVVRLR